MAEWESTPLVFQRMIDAIRTAEECSSRLSHLHEDVRYAFWAMKFGEMREKLIELAHKRADEKTRMGFQ